MSQKPFKDLKKCHQSTVYQSAVFGTLVRNKVKILYSVAPHVRIETKAAILECKKERDIGLFIYRPNETV